MATLTFVNGSIPAAGTDGNFVRVGHDSSLRNDAVWSFTTTTYISAVSFTFNWNNRQADGGPGTGYAGTFTDVFVLTTDGSAGRIAASTDSYLDRTTKSVDGSIGSVTVSFTDLSLAPGTYYIRANCSDSTTKTLKCYYQTVDSNGNAKATYMVTILGQVRVNINNSWKTGTVYVNVNGVWKQGIPYINVSGTWKQGI